VSLLFSLYVNNINAWCWYVTFSVDEDILFVLMHLDNSWYSFQHWSQSFKLPTVHPFAKMPVSIHVNKLLKWYCVCFVSSYLSRKVKYVEFSSRLIFCSIKVFLVSYLSFHTCCTYCDVYPFGPPFSWEIWIWGPGPPGWGSLLKWDSKIWSWVLRDLDPWVTALARPRSNCASKIHIHPLVREGAPHQETHSCQTEKKIWPWAPAESLKPRKTGRLTVGRNLTSTSGVIYWTELQRGSYWAELQSSQLFDRAPDRTEETWGDSSRWRVDCEFLWLSDGNPGSGTSAVGNQCWGDWCRTADQEDSLPA
jgi:hypothetical protein